MKKLLISLFSICIFTYSAFCQTSKSDSTLIVINHVKAGKRTQFEEFVKELFINSSKSNERDQKQLKNMRVLKPIEADEDGTYPYAFIFDPKNPQSDLDLALLLQRMYGKERGEAQLKNFSDTITKQTGYFLVEQSYQK